MQRLLWEDIRRGFTKTLALGAAIMLGGVCVLGGARTPGYDPLRQWVSHLALGPNGALYSLAVGTSGALLMATGRGLSRALPGFRAGPRAILAAGAGLLVAALFPTDPGLGYPVGVAPSFSLAGAIHRLAGLTVFVSLAAGPLVLGRWLGRRGVALSLRRWSFFVSVLVSGAWLGCSVLAGLDFSGVYSPAPSGLLERVALMAGTWWVASIALFSRSLEHELNR
jgi:hypothetical protein